LIPSFNILKKNLKKDTGNCPVIRVGLLADTASQLLSQAIRGYGIQKGLNFEIYEAEYNQIFQQIYNRSSELYEFDPEFTIINLSTEKLLKQFYKTEYQGQLTFAADQLGQIEAWLTEIQNYSKSKLILNTFTEINDGVFGNYAVKEKSSFIFQLRKLNLGLMELSQRFPDLFIVDVLSLQVTQGYLKNFDPKMYFSADMIYNLDFLPYVAKSIYDIIAALKGIFKKAVILDLDNTLWGGIIGDDGIEGIQIGEDGIGKAFNDFQLWLRQLKQRGIILAVCSKNTEEIAKEPFLSHPDMVLRLEDFGVFVANWENKVDNIRFIQSVLNIGMDSFVFLDDNPFEREMVRSAIPELEIPDLPEDPSEYLIYLRSLGLFETASFVEEDKHRTSLYREESKRNSLQKTFANEDEFLKSLEMEATLAPFNEFTLPRVAQLTQRSNQFNLRTKRYTESDIQQFMDDPKYYTLSCSLKDRFGNYGLISAVILKAVNKSEIFIDTWIMSCRVLKRGVEALMLNAIVDLAKQQGYEKLIGEFIPTKKNGLVKDHYRNLNFIQNSNCWVLDVKKYKPVNLFIKENLNTEETI
jgi:FkbH-like protein